ncbi:hypothetical protein Tco_0164498 [Tanacetum coccineum]
MSDSSYSNTSDLDDMDDIELIMQAIKHDQSLQQNEAESSRRRHNPINHESAEARLMADYFSEYPKHPDYYFRRRYRMHRSLFLEIVQDKVYEEREESCWISHLRTGIFYPKGHEGVMNEVPDGAASFASSYWLRNNDMYRV